MDPRADPGRASGLTPGIVAGGVVAGLAYAYAVWFSFDIGNPVGLFPGHIVGSIAGPFVAMVLNRRHPDGQHVKVAFLPLFIGLGLALPVYLYLNSTHAEIKEIVRQGIGLMPVLLIPVSLGWAMLARWAAGRIARKAPVV